MTSLAEKLARLKLPAAVAVTRIDAPFLPPTQTQHGPVRLIEQTRGPHYVQGKVLTGAARVAQASTIASLALDATLAGVDPARMLLVDTETTGLHGGSGTLPWVVGLSWFEDDVLIVRQLFLGEPGAERPLLKMLAEKIDAASVLVTFNGKCFDWPLLRTRFVMNRITPPVVKPHLDLLHCARRIFKRRLGATRLQDLEAAVLGFHREGDIPGAEIPAVYFDWLRDGDPIDVERVLEHNVQDLVSMAAILAELCRRFEGVDPEDAAEDCLSLARVAVRCDQPGRAEVFALAAVERATEPDVAFDALVLLAQGSLKKRDWLVAAERLEKAAALDRLDGERHAGAHLLLAKLCEHGLKDLEKALLHARLGSFAETAVASAKRIQRLARKALKGEPSRAAVAMLTPAKSRGVADGI